MAKALELEIGALPDEDDMAEEAVDVNMEMARAAFEGLKADDFDAFADALLGLLGL